ncbi:MAG TPA: ABC transporter ATP-binding protein [Herpetosiphonaceae bacterium]|nr:ABC transporter ATP-binding protein [Herpetosiphonaceae bacterium]
MTDSVLIRTIGLQRRYQMGKTTVQALDGVDLEVQRGTFVALIGPSGSGKSTLLNLIGGLDRPSKGELWVDGMELGRTSDKQLVAYRRDRVGFIFQSFNLLPTNQAWENVSLPLMLAGRPKSERYARAKVLLEQIGLGDRIDHRPSELSGGQQQRVAIARALANNPVLILADEPTGNLDSRTGREVLETMQNLVRNEGVTLLMVTHDLNAASYADRIVHLRDGKIERIEETAARPALEASV